MSDPIIYKTDDGNFVTFEWGTAKNEAASTNEGRPVFDKVLYVKVLSPGQAKSEMVYEALREGANGQSRKNERVCDRFASQIDLFMRKDSGAETQGTPLEELKFLDIRQVAELKALNIYTVEALAALSDVGLQKLGLGAREMQAKASAYLEQAAGNAPISRLTAENEELKRTVSRLEAQLSELSAKQDEKRGRSRKDAANE